MFFQKKANKAEQTLLQKKNIILNCKEEPKEEVIKKLGKLLMESGYVGSDYIDAMLEREKTFATYMGNGIALPHGVEQAKDGIAVSGIVVMIFPEGTDWDGEKAKVVIGIAAKGEEHLDILENIAMKLEEEESVNEIVSMSVDEIYDFMMRKEEDL